MGIPRSLLAIVLPLLLTGCWPSEDDDRSELGFGEAPRIAGEPMVGSAFTVRFTIRNRAGFGARSVAWRLLRDGSFLAQGTVDLVPGHGVSPVQGTTVTEALPGTKNYQVVLDPQNSIRERNESDNQAILTVVVAPAASG
jgi:subtilase family serine protease